MTRCPRLELAGEVVLARLPQFAHEARIPCHQPIFQFIQRVHGFEDLGRNLNGVSGSFQIGFMLPRTGAKASAALTSSWVSFGAGRQNANNCLNGRDHAQNLPHQDARAPNDRFARANLPVQHNELVYGLILGPEWLPKERQVA